MKVSKLSFLLVLFIIPLVALPHPSAFAQTPEFEPIITVGYDYTITQIGELEFQQESHQPYLLDFNGEYIPYRLTDGTNFVQVEVAEGKLVFDKINGAVTMFSGVESLIDSDSYQVRVAELGSDVWTVLDVNNAPVTTTIVEDGDKIFVTFTRTNDEGTFNVEYLVRSGVKTTASFTNNVYDNHKFAFTQTLNLVDNIITLNDQEINLTDYIGQTFDRDTLVANQALVLEAKGLFFNAGIGFDNLWSVGIFDDNRIALDYAYNGLGIDEVKTAIGETVELDPSVTLTAYQLGGISNTAGTWLQKGAYSGSYSGFAGCAANYWISIGGYTGTGAGYCGRQMFPFDITSIPDGATISDVKLKSTKYYQYYHGDVDCRFMSVESNTLGSTASPSGLFTDAADGTLFLHDTGSSHTATSGNACVSETGSGYGNRWAYDVVWDLGANADADLQAELAVDNEWAVGLYAKNTEASGISMGHLNTLYETGYPLSLTVTYTVPPPPDVPTSVSIDTQDVANELTLRWVAPASGTTPDGYKIGRSVDGGTFNDSYVADTGTTAITYDNTGLSPDTSYAYRVWSLDGAVTSTSYASVAGTTTWDVPDQVGTVTGTSGISPALSWSAPSSDGVLTNYKIYRDGTLHDTISSSGTTYSDSTSVVSGTTYGYTVSGVSAVGEGSQSVSINVVSGIPPDPPTITGTSIDDPNVAPLDIIIDWSSPLYTGTAGITNYEVYRDAVLITTVGNVNTHTDTVPSGGGTFVYSLKSVSSHGTSILSATASQTTATPPPAPVSAPTLDIANPNPSPLDVTVTFAMPSSGGSAITSFEIFRSTDDIIFSSVGTTTTLIFSDTVPNAGTFYYKLSAINLVGTGLQSPSSNITTPNVPDAITDLAVSVITDTTATLTWTAPNSNGSNIVDYTLYRDGVLISTSATTGFSDTGLITQTSYVYTVYARNNVGLSLISNSVTQVTDGVPDVVSFTATNTNSNQIDLTWSEPNDFNSAITSYVIERESPIGGGFTELITLGSVLSYSDGSLSPVTEYNYRILAVNGYGNSPTSTSSATTVSAPPTSLIVHDRSHTLTTALDLEWVAPVPSTGVNGYKITYETPVGNGFGTLVANTSNTNLYYNHTGLNAGQFYNYKVQALTPHGESQVSNSYAFTPHKLSDAVDDLVVTSNALLQHVLNWSTPDNLYGTLSGYMINYTTPAGDPQTIHTSDTGSATTTINVSGLNPTIEYSFRIAAVTYHGVNATGNIGNGTTSSEIEVGDLDFSVQVNPNASPINYVLYNVDSSTDDVQVVFDSALNLDCSITERNTGDITNYTSISETTSGSNVYHNFTVTNAGLATGLDFDCWDTTDITVNGQYTLTQGLSSSIFGGYGNVPMFSLMSNFTNGFYGTEGEFAGIDLITLFIVIVSMLFFNRTNPALGVGGMFMFLGVAWAFELIPWTSGLLGAIAVMLVFAIGQGMKNR